MAYITRNMISPAEFTKRMILAGHKQMSLAKALGCCRQTIGNFQKGRTKTIQKEWGALVRELKLDSQAGQ